MKHTPFGYDIKEGEVVINKEQASCLRQICQNYLSGMGFAAAAEAAGMKMYHAGVKRMLHNRKYLGDAFFPQILDEGTFQRIEEERQRRSKALGRDNKKGKPVPEGKIYKQFSSPNIPRRYTDPIAQAEYAYSLITGKEDG